MFGLFGKKSKKTIIDESNVNTNALVTLGDGNQKTVSQLLFIAGRNQRLQEEVNELKKTNERLMEQLFSVKKDFQIVSEEKIKKEDDLTDTERTVYDFIRDNKVRVRDVHKLIIENKKIPISSKSSSYRIIKNLLDSKSIIKNKGCLKVA